MGKQTVRHLPAAKLILFSGVVTVLFFGAVEMLARAIYHADCTSVGRLESYLESVGSTAPQTLEESLQRSAPMPYDPFLIWHLVANFKGQNLGVEVVHNSRGLRSPEISLEKPANTSRILLLGDSTIYGHGVRDTEMIRTRLEQTLRQALPNRRIQVINGGVPGYSSLQSLNQFRRLSHRFQPDIVVIANIWSDCVLDRFQDREVIYGTGLAGQTRHAAQWINERLAPRSAAYCFFKEKVFPAPARQCEGRPPLCAPPPETLNPDQQHQAGFRNVRQPGSDESDGAREDRLQRPRVPPEEYRSNLLALSRQVRRHGGREIFLLLANGVELEEFEDPESTVGSYLEYRHIMRVIAIERDTPAVDIVAAFQQEKRRSPAPLFMDRVHPNPAGHAVMANTLARALLDAPLYRAILEGR